MTLDQNKAKAFIDCDTGNIEEMHFTLTHALFIDALRQPSLNFLFFFLLYDDRNNGYQTDGSQ